MSIKNQVAINAIENVKTKIAFEREAQSQGVVIKGYHTDNGILNDSDFYGGAVEEAAEDKV